LSRSWGWWRWKMMEKKISHYLEEVGNMDNLHEEIISGKWCG
jgi:hypothetical protein